MKIAICVDNTFPLACDALVKQLNKLSGSIAFSALSSRARIESPYVSPYITHGAIQKDLGDIRVYDFTIVATMVPYEDNFFFYAKDDLYIISFFGWNMLTDLPIGNGLVYFIAEIIGDYIGMGPRHDSNIGCLNDFLEDKTGIDIGMRTAYLCPVCKGHVRSQVNFKESLFKDLLNILDFLSRASRANKNVVDLDATAFEPGASGFDVFMCHNSQDKPEIREINQKLKTAMVNTWLDEDQLPLGVPWQPELEKHIQSIRNAAVFVGKSGLGPWQNLEMRSFLEEFANRSCRVIPVILPSAVKTPELPRFLRQMTWLDLREDFDKKLDRLISTLRKTEIS
jgi:hypothetical protein